MWDDAVLWFFNSFQVITVGAFIFVACACWAKQLWYDKIPHENLKSQDMLAAGFNASLIIGGMALLIGAFDSSAINRIDNLSFYIAVSAFISFFTGISGLITAMGQKTKP